MISLTGARGRGFGSNVNGSDAELREQLIQSIITLQSDMAQIKSEIVSFQDIARFAPIVVQHINADRNLSAGDIQNITLLNQMIDDVNRLSTSFEEVQDLAADIARRL